MARRRWLVRGDIVIDCSAYRLPFKWVISRRGSSAVGRYGMGVARRWLMSLGINLERHHAFVRQGVPVFYQGFFDPGTKIAYEVKTGRQPLSDRTVDQIIAYERAIRTHQAKIVAYLNAAVEGRVGLAPRYREELRKRRLRLLILR